MAIVPSLQEKNMFVFAIETDRKVSAREKKITPLFSSSNYHGFVELFSNNSRERRIPFKTSQERTLLYFNEFPEFPLKCS